jgi:hypothetical protein
MVPQARKESMSDISR